ncbi:hypothetical protein PanWU01x14_228140, partial [Parasponia andersonii]
LIRQLFLLFSHILLLLFLYFNTLKTRIIARIRSVFDRVIKDCRTVFLLFLFVSTFSWFAILNLLILLHTLQLLREMIKITTSFSKMRLEIVVLDSETLVQNLDPSQLFLQLSELLTHILRTFLQTIIVVFQAPNIRLKLISL